MGRNTWIKQPREEDGDVITSDLSDDIEHEHDDDSASKQEPRRINIGGKATTLMGKGDRLLIETPGGGAWGSSKRIEEDRIVAVGKLDVSRKAKDMITWDARGSLAERLAVQAGF